MTFDPYLAGQTFVHCVFSAQTGTRTHVSTTNLQAKRAFQMNSTERAVYIYERRCTSFRSQREIKESLLFVDSDRGSNLGTLHLQRSSSMTTPTHNAYHATSQRLPHYFKSVNYWYYYIYRIHTYILYTHLTYRLLNYALVCTGY